MIENELLGQSEYSGLRRCCKILQYGRIGCLEHIYKCARYGESPKLVSLLINSIKSLKIQKNAQIIAGQRRITFDRTPMYYENSTRKLNKLQTAQYRKLW